MKSLILLVLGIGLAASTLNNERVYEPNSSYEYSYKVQILSGQPETSKTSVSLRLDARVRITFLQTKHDMVLTLDSVRVHQLMKELPVRPSAEIFLPDSDFTLVPAETITALKRELEKPIRARRENGQIMALETLVGDTEYSVNAKKALLSSINLKLQDDSISPPPFTKNPVFRTNERTFFGDCEPLYRVFPAATLQAEPVMKVTKIVDPLRCTDRPIHMALYSMPNLCLEAHYDQRDGVKSTMSYDYELIQGSTDFFIQTVNTKSVQVMLPMGPEQGSLAQFIKAQLTYVGRVEPEVDRLPEFVPRPEGLRMFVEELMQEKPIVMERRLKTTVISELARLVERYVTLPVENKPKMMLKLVKLLSEASVADLRKLMETVLRVPVPPQDQQELPEDQKQLKRGLIVEILPAVSTQESLFVLKSLILTLGSPNTVLTVREAREVLSMLSLAAKPTKQDVNQIHEITNFGPVIADEKLNQAAWLAYANVLKRLLVDPIKVLELKEPITAANDLTFIQKQQKIIDELYNLARTEEEQLLAVKVMANVPLPDYIHRALSIVRDPEVTIVVRMEAAKALDLHAQLQPKMVVRQVLPVVMNVALPTELRIVLFRAVILARPGTPQLLLIKRWLLEENNYYVKSYAYSYLLGVSKTTLPCLKDWARKVRAILKTIRPQLHGIQFARGVYKSWNSDLIRQGLYTEASYITTPDSLVPKYVQAKTGFYLLGRHINILEFSANTQGLQTLLHKMFGPAGSWKNSDSIFDMIRKKHSSTTTPTAPSRRAYSGGLPPPEVPIPRPMIVLSMKMFESEMPYQIIDKQFTRNMMTDGRFHVNDIDEYLREGFPINFKKNLVTENLERLLPTPAGLPLRMKYQAVLSIKHEGRARLVVEPALFRAERNRQVPDKIRVKLESKPEVAMYKKLALDVEIPVVQIGSRVHMKLKASDSYKLQIEAEPKENKFRLEKDLQYPQPQEVLKMSIKPKNILKLYPEPIGKLESLQDPNKLVLKKELEPKPHKFVQHRFHYVWTREISPVTALYRRMELIGSHYHNVRTSNPLRAPLAPFKGPALFILRNKPYTPTELPEKLVVTGQLFDVEPSSSEDDWQREGRSPVQSGQTYTKARLVVATTKLGRETPLVTKTIYYQYVEARRQVLTELHLKLKRSNGADYEICFTGDARLPEVEETYTRTIPEYETRPFLKVDVTFGKCTQERPAIKAKVFLRKSRQQSEQEEAHTSWPEYQSCMSVDEEERKVNPACRKLAHIFAQRKHYHIVVDTDRNQIPRDFLPLLDEGDVGEWPWQNIAENTRSEADEGEWPWMNSRSEADEGEWPWMNSRSEADEGEWPWMNSRSEADEGEWPWMNSRSEADEGEWPWMSLFGDAAQPTKHFEFDVTMLNDQIVPNRLPETASDLIRLTMRAPGKKERSRLFRLPYSLPPSNMHVPYWMEVAQHATSRQFPARCQLTKSHLKTFDDLYVRADMDPNCEFILSEDRSPSRRFRVLIKPGGTTNLPRRVKVEAGDHVVEVAPSQHPSHGPIAIVNGQPLLNDSMRVPNSGKVEVYVARDSGTLVRMGCIGAGIGVLTDGNSVQITASPVHRGQLGALCGNYDGQKPNDRRMSDMRETELDQAYINSYKVPSETCRPTEPFVSRPRYGDDRYPEHRETTPRGRRPLLPDV